MNFYVLYGSVKKVLCPLWPTVNMACMFLYCKVAILNVSKDRFDHWSVYLGEMKLSFSGVWNIHVVQKGFWRFKLQMDSCFAKETVITETLSLWLLYGTKNIKAPFTVGHKGYKTFFKLP